MGEIFKKRPRKALWQTAVGMAAESPEAAPLQHFKDHKRYAAAEDLQRTARHPQK